MKVIQIVPEFRRGGGEKIAYSLHQSLLSRAIDSTLLVIKHDSFASSFPHVISLGGRSPRDLSVVPRLRRYLDSVGSAVLHSHLFPAQFASMWVTNPQVKLVTTEHSTHNKRRGHFIWRLVDLAMYSRFSRVVAISEAVAVALGNWVPRTKSKTLCIHNGVAVEMVSFSELPPRKMRLVSVGRLVEVKNFARSVSAVASLRSRGLEVEYDIYGEGPNSDRLKCQIRSLGASEYIHLMGRTENIETILEAYSAIVIPSLWEGFGLVAVEAMAAGLPVICSDVAGMAEVVDPTSTHFFTPTEEESIANAILSAAGDGTLTSRDVRLRMRERAKQYSLSRMVDHHLQVYEQVLAEPPPY